MKTTIKESTIRLFKAVPIKIKKGKANKKLLEKTIKKGFIFSPEVVYNYSDFDELIKLVEKTIGITAEKLNNSFHKSWTKIKEADLEQLVVEQIAHYLTTYGKDYPEEYIEEKGEQWGVNNLGGKIIGLKDFKSNKVGSNYIYIPKEKLEIPNLNIDNIQLVVIKGYTKKELKEKLLNLLSSGIALKEETIKDVLDIAIFVKLNEEEIRNIKNKEVKIALYDYLNLVPENPVEFLRYVVYKTIGKTLLIKSSAVIREIREAKKEKIVKLFADYGKEYGLPNLAKIFYRFKPIFLALRTTPKLKPYVNRIRRLAVIHHKPMPEDYLNSITAKIKKGEKIDEKKLMAELDRVNIFRKIRLSYALKFRTKSCKSILYKIRNGKGYATDFSFSKQDIAKSILNIVLESITKNVSKNVKGKKIYIPEHVNYSLPMTEKQFTGNFPSGTFVSIPRDMIFGIHWENVNGHPIDLDLSMIKPSGEKIGWDASYRTESRDILFSGDIVDAPKPRGATELFYVKRQKKEASILFVNYFNYNEEREVPFKIIVAKEHPNDFKENYMVNPNNVISVVESKINKREKILGLMITTTNECRFYFAETYIGRSISSGGSEFVDNSREYLLDFYENTISLKDILEKSGAKIVNDKENIDDEDNIDIDLSPEVLEKDSILNLLK